MTAAVAEGVVRRYRRGTDVVNALAGVDLAVERGRMTAVVGPSGSGKSTLLHLLAGLDRPDEGRISVAGVDLAALDDDERADLRRCHVGLVFQFFHLLPDLTAWENVALPVVLGPQRLRDGRRRATELLELVGLGDRVDHRPRQLSGGQLQRIAVARALMAEPTLVLADEPTGSLDSVAGALVTDLLADLAHSQGRAVVVVTHDPRVGERADRVVSLADGRIVDDTEPLR